MQNQTQSRVGHTHFPCLASASISDWSVILLFAFLVIGHCNCVLCFWFRDTKRKTAVFSKVGDAFKAMESLMSKLFLFLAMSIPHSL